MVELASKLPQLKVLNGVNIREPKKSMLDSLTLENKQTIAKQTPKKILSIF